MLPSCLDSGHLIGYLIINLIDMNSDRVRDDEGLGDSAAVWRARLFLFIGFAFMVGGRAGSVTETLAFEIHLAHGTITVMPTKQVQVEPTTGLTTTAQQQ